MAEILNRFEVNDALKKIIEAANNQIILISPYIKLNTALKAALQKHREKKDFKLIVVYGKNEEDTRSSLSDADFDFFKSFPNVEIRYHKRLHAKLYANDYDTLITSMNLHSYSIKENIEVGIILEMNLLRDIGNFLSNAIGNSLESQAREFAEYVIEKSTIHFQREAKKESSLFGLFTSHKKPEVIVDKPRSGFCIRTKQLIPFNLNMPFSSSAYASWQRYGNKLYEEKYCHQCGQPNKTSFAKPICFDCFHK